MATATTELFIVLPVIAASGYPVKINNISNDTFDLRGNFTHSPFSIGSNVGLFQVSPHVTWSQEESYIDSPLWTYRRRYSDDCTLN